MTEATTATLAPVTGTSRIDVLDMLRGIAILGIFFMNIPFMGASIVSAVIDIRAMGWTPADQASWTAVQVMLEGTQRGLLEMLFGAGLMVLARQAMRPDGPVAVADLYTRRNLWLLAFGVFDIFVLGWAGDILHVYALAALFLFPFRKLGPKLLVAFGLIFAAYSMVHGGMRYAERVEVMHKGQAAVAKQAAKAPLTAEEKKSAEAWQKLVASRQGKDPQLQGFLKEEAKGHAGSFLDYVKLNIAIYIGFVFPSLMESASEALCMMMVGLALWKWGVIQGERSARFYLVLMLACYAVALPLRYLVAMDQLIMVPIPRLGWITQEPARMLASIGHVGLINLVVKSGIGRAILAPFKAAGRTAFSLYFIQQVVGLWILFAPWGPGLWGTLSWGGIYSVAVAVILAELVLANLWVRYFANGPFEWAWRSLSYVKRQPFLKRPAD